MAHGKLMQRARSSEQKTRRRQALLDAARQVFEYSSYEAITMMQIAEAASLGKATIYSYFGTKEELFLALYQQLMGAVFDDMRSQLVALAVHASAEQVAGAMAGSWARHPLMLRLFTTVHLTLKSNVPAAVLAAYKQWMAEQTAAISELIEAHFQFITPGDGRRVVALIYSFLLGFFHFSAPGQLAASTMEGFASEFEAVIRTFLIGLEVQNSSYRSIKR